MPLSYYIDMIIGLKGGSNKVQLCTHLCMCAHKRMWVLQMPYSASGALNQENNSRCTNRYIPHYGIVVPTVITILCTTLVLQRVMVHRQNRINSLSYNFDYATHPTHHLFQNSPSFGRSANAQTTEQRHQNTKNDSVYTDPIVAMGGGIVWDEK